MRAQPRAHTMTPTKTHIRARAASAKPHIAPDDEQILVQDEPVGLAQVPDGFITTLVL